MAATRTVQKVQIRQISVTNHHIKTNNGSTPRYGESVGAVTFVIHGQGHALGHRSYVISSYTDERPKSDRK